MVKKTYMGSNKTIRRSRRTIIGSNNTIYGDGNTIIGSNNEVIGNRNRITGSNCEIRGNRNRCRGSNNEFRGNENRARGSNNELTGFGNVARGGANNFVNGVLVVDPRNGRQGGGGGGSVFTANLNACGNGITVMDIDGYSVRMDQNGIWIDGVRVSDYRGGSASISSNGNGITFRFGDGTTYFHPAGGHRANGGNQGNGNATDSDSD